MPVVEGSTTQTKPSAAPVRKVIAGLGGAGFGGATSDLIVGALADLFNGGQPIPEYLAVWIAIFIPALFAGLAGYLTPRAPGE